MSNGVLTTHNMPSPIRESINTMVLLSKSPHVVISRLARQDTLHWNKGDVISRISMERLGYLSDAKEDADNAALMMRYTKRAYSINRHAGHIEISTKLLQTSVENVALQADTLLTIAAQETDELQVLKMAIRDGISYTCTLGTTAAKVTNMTELSPDDVSNLVTQLDYAGVTATEPLPIFGSNFFGSKGKNQNTYCAIVPAEYKLSFDRMVNANTALAVNAYARSEMYIDMSELGLIGGNMKLYKTTMLKGTKNADGKKVFAGVVLGADTITKLNGLVQLEEIFQPRSIASKEGSFASIGKSMYCGSAVLRPMGVYTVKFCEYVPKTT